MKRWAFWRKRRPDSDLRTRRNAVYFCATCCASEGEEHLNWCHRIGVMRRPEVTE